MKRVPKVLTVIISTIFFAVSFSVSASDLPDPEVLAKQYLKDLCTLNEQDFTRKYMLTHADLEDFMESLNKGYIESGERSREIFSDSLVIRSEVHSLVVNSYRVFKEWQHENEIDSSKIKYHSCEFELEKRRKIPYYSLEDMRICFTYDTINYGFSCDDFLYLKTKWVGGDSDGIYKLDKYFKTVHDYDYAGDISVDTVVAYEYVTEAVYDEQPVTKKQLKIQKKIDAYNRKIDALYSKQYE